MELNHMWYHDCGRTYREDEVGPYAGYCQQCSEHLCRCGECGDVVATIHATRTDIAIAHNGMLDFEDREKLLSDTAIFTRDVLAHDSVRTHLHEEYMQNLLKDATKGSRIVIWGTSFGMLILGSGWITYEGIIYSNSDYKKKKWEWYDSYIWMGMHDSRFWSKNKKYQEWLEHEETLSRDFKRDLETDERNIWKDKRVCCPDCHTNHTTMEYTIDGGTVHYCYLCGLIFEVGT